MKTYTVTLSVTVPDSTTRSQFRDHVKEAVKGWGGQYHPSHPLFSANVEKAVIHGPVEDDHER